MADDTLTLKQLKTFLIERKTKALLHESRATGTLKATLTGQIQAVDAFLIYLSSNMEKDDMNKLELTLDEPIKIEADASEANKQLAAQLAKLAETVPVGHKQRIRGLINKEAQAISSKMWRFREQGLLPKTIVPIFTKNKAGDREVYIAHKTEEQVAKMRKRGRAAA